jgi:hypothetical protein
LIAGAAERDAHISTGRKVKQPLLGQVKKPTVHSAWKTEIPKALADLQSCCSIIGVALPTGDGKTICNRHPVSVARQFALSPQESDFQGKEQDPHVDLDSDA